MSDKWEALKAWLETERAAAAGASREAAAAVTAAIAASARDFNTAVKEADTVNGRCAALREVAEEMAELERETSRPRQPGQAREFRPQLRRPGDGSDA